MCKSPLIFTMFSSQNFNEIISKALGLFLIGRGNFLRLPVLLSPFTHFRCIQTFKDDYLLAEDGVWLRARKEAYTAVHEQ